MKVKKKLYIYYNMNIIINEKSYQYWNLPTLPKKRSKPQKVTLCFYGQFLDQEVSDIIIIKGYKYQWIFKGCKLEKIDTKKNKNYLYDVHDTITNLTILYEQRSGSHLEEDIKSDIRDWTLRNIFH